MGAAGEGSHESKKSVRWLNQVEASYTSPVFDRQILTVGAEFRNEGRKDAEGVNNNLDNASLFIQDEIQITDSLYVVGGFRYDDHCEFGGAVTSRISQIYDIQRVILNGVF